MSTRHESVEQAADQLMDHAEKLIWDFLDDRIDESDLKHLEQLIEENEQVRARYLDCAQVHADLYEHYQMATPAELRSPVLGSVAGMSSPIDPSQITD